METYRKTLLDKDQEFRGLLITLNIMAHKNLHGFVLVEIATYFNMGKYVRIFTGINNLHDAEGHLPHHLGLYRDDKAKEMYNIIEQSHGSDMVRKLKTGR
jgi:hypothetical protein